MPKHRRLVGSAAVVACLALGCASAAGAARATAPARPDLVESAVLVSPLRVVTGGPVRVTDTLVNRGRATAPASSTGLYLSRHPFRSAGDLLLGRRPAPRLRPGASSLRTTRLVLPASTRAGAYRVVACADDRRRVRERREGDNCRATAAVLHVTPGPDRTAPTFAGLREATTCIPGPVGPGRSSVYRLAWDPAEDDVTPASAIVYDVYQATQSGAEDFTAPTYTTTAGATSFTTPSLPGNQSQYFVVRARDAAGNRDGNLVERQGVNVCV